MAGDFDASAKASDEFEADSLEELQSTSTLSKSSYSVDVDENELAESLELPGADLSDESLTVLVVPVQPDEFTCSRCFLVRHRSQIIDPVNLVCSDCD